MHPFWKITPGGNPTILLRAEDVPADRRATLAAAVMEDQHLHAEQVGYVRLSGTPRLDMMGGEFCLNATRAFALLLAEQGLLQEENGVLSGLVEVSGVAEPVAVRVTRREGSLPVAEACLHFTDLPRPEALEGGLTMVRLPGICHMLQSGQRPAPAEFAAFCEHQRRDCGVDGEEAVGHLWVTPEDSPAGVPAGKTDSQPAAAAPRRNENGEHMELLSMYPVVWVRDTATLCHESACGSGTLACALAAHAASGALSFGIRQPSGFQLTVRLEKTPDGWDVWTGGPARMTARGETDLTGFL